MLAADKLLLEGKIAQGSVRLKWKEFKLHHMNLETVGTQAAVMAGFSVSALIKFHTHSEVDRRLLHGRRADISPTSRDDAAACDVDIP